jgi:hypothetical protein
MTQGTVARAMTGLVGLAHLVGTAAVAAPRDVPLDPDADQARRWLQDELLDPAYHVQPTLLERALTWIQEQLAHLQDLLSSVDSRSASVSVVLVLVAVAALALIVAGPVRRARRVGRRASNTVLDDDTRTAAQLRADADAHAAAGRWAAAVLDRFRAILRSLEERVVLDERPGRTADEAAVAAAARFPALAGALVAAGALFDEVCYGDVVPAAEDDRRLRELDATLARTRPTRADRTTGVADDGADDDLLDPRTAVPR